MKTADIQQGNVYAWKRSSYATAVRAVAVAVGVEIVYGRSSYGIRSSRELTNKSGVKVRFDDGSERVVPSREIAEKWSDHEAREARIAEARRERAEQDKREREANARVIAFLSCVGVESARAAGMGIVIPAESHEALIELCRDAKAYRKQEHKRRSGRPDADGSTLAERMKARAG